jgi:hypothetical protein
MTNKRDLKAFVRYDGSGRVVAGSLILRRKKPKVGKWTEIQGYQCCNIDQGPIMVTIEGSFPISSVDVVVQALNGDYDQYQFTYTGLNAANINELLSVLNTAASNVGHFTLTDGNLFVTLNSNLASFFAANHTTAIGVFTFAD